MALQGGYLYDKGENDELFYETVASATDLRVYFNTSARKSKGKNEKKFFSTKMNLYKQKML